MSAADAMTADEAARFYGATGAEWLERWDAGRTVWSVEMGGLGPGYEQCVQVTAAEMLRHMLAEKYDASLWGDREAWSVVSAALDSQVMSSPVVRALGLSGAQWGAAMNLASVLYRRGPLAFMDEKLKGRLIHVRPDYPRVGAA